MAAALNSTAETAAMPAAEHLAHRAGLEQALSGLVTGGAQDLSALALFGGLAVVLYRTALRRA